MTLNERVLAMEADLLSCLQENLRIPSVEGTPAEGAPYGVEIKRSLDHVLTTAEKMGFRTQNVDGHVGWVEYGDGEEMVAVLGHLDGDRKPDQCCRNEPHDPEIPGLCRSR